MEIKKLNRYLSIKKTYLSYYNLGVWQPGAERHTSALGYYPGSLDAIKKLMKENLAILNKILAKDGLTLESAIPLFLPYNEMQIINNYLYHELRNIADSEEKGIKSACLMFEEQADFIALGQAKVFKQNYDSIFKSILK